MSKISQIEAELKTMEQGKFQKLCSSFLYLKHNLPPRGEGEAKGTDKTTTGTPDSFLVLPNGNFIFIEYTTQQTGIGKKFLGDLEKNFNEEKTNIPIHKIEKVFLCYNSQLSPGETNKIIDFCFSNNTKVEFIDLDFLKLELYYYPKLAKDFLNVEPDTEQILRPDDFIKELENKGTSQTNKFFAREEELKKLAESLQSNNIIVIAGKAGTGKTRVAREAILQFIDENKEYEPFCILTKGQSLYYDLKAYFLPGRKYVVIVDDANRIGDFPTIARLTNSEKFEVKIIITVRDYAFEKIKKHLETENFSFDTLELKPLEDETVREILKSIKVTNPLCVNNITRIANGNPRLVIMSAEHALVDDNCYKLHDVTDIYDKFFEPLVSTGELKDKNLLKVLGIICFFRVVDRNHEQLIHRIYDSFGIDENDFWECVFKLHDLEFVNLYERRVVKIADQILANYFFYLTFLKEEILDLYIILDQYLSEYKGKVKENLYPILEHFKYEKILTIVSPKLDKKLLEIRENEKELLDFFEVFGFYQQEEILLHIQSQIEQLPEPSPEPYQFRRENNNNWWKAENEYPLFKLLTLFGQSPNDHFEISLELIFRYVQKSPDILPDVIQYFEDHLIFDEDDYGDRYGIQRRLFEFLYRRIDKAFDNQLFAGVLFEIAPKFLKTHFQPSKGGRNKNSIVIYNIVIQKTPEIEEFRKGIFKRIFSFETTFNEKVLSFLENYCNSWEHYPQNEIYEYDTQFVIAFIQQNLSPSNFRHCQIVHDYFKTLDRLKVNPVQAKELLQRFRNQQFTVNEVLTFSYTDWYREDRKRDINKFFDYNKKRLAKHFSTYKLEDYFWLIEEIEVFVKNNDRDAHTIMVSLETILLNILEASPKDCLDIINHLFEIRNPYSFDSFKIVHDLLQHFPTEKIYEIITKNEFNRKQLWLLYFFMSLKVEQINPFYKDELLTLFSSFEISLFSSFEFLENYKPIEPNIYKKVFEVLLEKVERGNFHLELHAPDFFEKHFAEFESDLTILKKIYFHCSFKQRLPFDGNGAFFKKIYYLDRNFLFEFIEEALRDKVTFARDDIKFNFHFVWEINDAGTIIDKVITFTIDKKIYSGRNHVASKFFPSNGLSQRIDNFFNTYIQAYSTDKNRMKAIFSVIYNCYPDERVKYLQKLLTHNRDLELWWSLPIASSGYSGLVSSLIPYYEDQIEFWESLLPIFTGKVEYLKHRQWVQSKIKSLRNDIERQIEWDFIDDY